MNIFFRELKASARSMLLWAAFMVFFIYMGISKYEAFTQAGSDVMQMMDSIPDAILDVFAINAFNLTTLSGYYGVMYVYFALIGAIFAVLRGNNIIAKEERDKTVEFTLTLPITRQRLITAKIAAALVNCILFVLFIWGSSYIAVQPFNPEPEFFDFLSLMMVSVFMIELIFLAIGVLLGAAMKEYKRSGSVAVSIILGTYVLSIISDLSEDFEFLKYFTPFKYFNQVKLLNESAFETEFFWLSAGIIVVSIAAAYFSYSRRDLYI